MMAEISEIHTEDNWKYQLKYREDRGENYALKIKIFVSKEWGSKTEKGKALMSESKSEWRKMEWGTE